MAAGWTLTVTGTNELRQTLQTLPEAIAGQVLLDSLTTAAEPMRDRMRSLAPRGAIAPHLADSITIAPVRSDAVSAVIVIGPTRAFFYGRFWEFGWKYHSAHPFMRPGYDEEAWPTVDRLRRDLWAEIADWVAAHVEVTG